MGERYAIVLSIAFSTNSRKQVFTKSMDLFVPLVCQIDFPVWRCNAPMAEKRAPPVDGTQQGQRAEDMGLRYVI
jgi:hypothetical protein